MSKLRLMSLTLIAAGLLTACGGSGSQAFMPPPTVSVSVSPSGATLDQGATFQFDATVSGTSNQQVTWSIQEGSAGGAITAGGLYTAPATATTVHVVATSVADSTKSAAATVTINTVAVSLQPDTIAIKKGAQRQLVAVVSGTVLDTSVTWSIQEGAAGGTITGAGLYTAPANGGPFHIIATSVADPSKNATASIVLADAGFRPVNGLPVLSRFLHSATLLPDGRVLVAGGLEIVCSDCNSLPTATAELFDPATETFSATGSMTRPRWNHTATLLNDGTVLMAGGSGDETAEIYDPATGSFALLASAMAVDRATQTATLLPDGRVFLAGGFYQVGFDVTDTTDIYDPATQTFSPAAVMPAFVGWHAASLLQDGTVLVTAGTDGCDSVPNVGLFDPSGNAFSVSADLATPRALHTATTLNDGRVLIAGGAIFVSCEVQDSIDSAVIFDPATSTYSSPIAMREARHAHPAVLLNDGKVLVVQNTADLFDPATNAFSITGDPLPSEVSRRATRLADGRVLLTGGTGAAEIYE